MRTGPCHKSSPMTKKPAPRRGRPRVYGAKLQCSITPQHAKLVKRWANEDGIDVPTLLAEMIERERQWRDGIIIRTHVAVTRG